MSNEPKQAENGDRLLCDPWRGARTPEFRKFKRDFKKNKMVAPRTGRMTMKYSPLANDEDFVIGVREGRELARVEVLSGPDYQNTDDVEYFKKMLHGALRVPASIWDRTAVFRVGRFSATTTCAPPA